MMSLFGADEIDVAQEVDEDRFGVNAAGVEMLFNEEEVSYLELLEEKYRDNGVSSLLIAERLKVKESELVDSRLRGYGWIS